MRFSLIAALAAATALSGCMVPVTTAPAPVAPAPVIVTPAPRTPVVVVPPPTTTRVPDTPTARQVISAELAKRAPGRNVGPLTDCVVANASQAELADIAAMQGKPAAANAVATIVSKPATTQCISRAIA